MKLDLDQIRQIVNEEINKHHKDLNKKLSLYTAKLSKLREEKSQEYLTEDQDSEELLSEVKMLDKVIEDLNRILQNEE